MEYEFQNIERFVKEILGKETYSSREYLKLQQRLFIEVDEFLKTVRLNAVQISSFESRRSFIQCNQQSLIWLLDETSDKSKCPTLAEDQANFLELTKTKLLELLTILNDQFPDEFARYFIIPKCQEDQLRNLLQHDVISLTDRLSHSKINCELINLCLTTVSNQLDLANTGGINFRTRFKVVNLVNRLSHLCSLKEDTRRLEQKIAKLFVEFDIDSEGSRDYFINYLNRGLDQSETISCQLEFLIKMQRWIDKILVERQCKACSQSLKEFLVFRIEDEIQLLKIKHQIVGEHHQIFDRHNDFKLNFDMSVAQFACFIKTLVDSGIIQNKNISELTRFFASHSKTKRSDNVSHESFRMKYYNVETSTKESVQNILQNAIKHIKGSMAPI